MTGVKPYVLRNLYHELTHDASGSRTSQGDIDEYVKQVLESKDHDVIVHLREMNEGRAAKYDNFGTSVRSTPMKPLLYQSFIMVMFASWPRPSQWGSHPAGV